MPNHPADILSAWMALEALSPQTFRRRSEFKLGKRRVLNFDMHNPPWTDCDARDEESVCFYQVVFGTISMEKAFDRLAETYGDQRPERPMADGEAIVATLTVDERGVPAGSASASVSCFAWALPFALDRRLDRLDGWTRARQTLRTGLRAQVGRIDPEGELMPLDGPVLARAYEWLLEQLGVDREMVVPPAFCVRSPRRDKASPPPDPLLLDSFFLDDLVAARGLFLEDEAPPALRSYLQVAKPATQLPLGSQEPASLNAARRLTLPRRFPPARWPARGRRPLVLNQQLAVNAAMCADADRPLLAVNGPPGTGKTTILRDIVAANVVRRAEAMASFEHPSAAFSPYLGNVVKVDGRRLGYFPVAPEIRGFEMLVVSSNNKAVENVTAELPGLEAIAEDALTLRYFKTVSDHLLAPRKTWGLMAAVLGSAANRRTFRESFWWDRDAGLYHYLDFVRPPRPGRHGPNRLKDPDRPVIRNERPPPTAAGVEMRWQEARQRFRAARTAVREHGARLQSVWDYMVRDSVRDRQLRHLGVRRGQHETSRPGWLARACRTRRYRRWRWEGQQIERDAAAALQAHADAERAFVRAAPLLLRDLRAAPPASPGPSEAPSTADWFESVRAALGDRLMDRAFAAAGHAEQQLRTPWFDAHGHRLRDDLFVAAMQLHRAFIDGAAKQLQTNLGLLMDVFADRQVTFSKPDDPAQLWASLFLVTPVASSTFASVRRMLDGLPPESLGWLLVDEAGHAVPQSAVGALMRTQRAVIVGDPLQIEPVVTLPDGFTPKICEHFDVDPGVFNAPEASVQTLADAAGPFAGRLGPANVGVPLLVHRRCADPMFAISNRVAYDGLMVSGVRERPSPIRDVLGESRWFDVRSPQSGDGEKWSEEEGARAVSLLGRLEALGRAPDLHIITPFRVVQDRLRQRVLTSGVLARVGVPGPDRVRWVRDRIGTVHTFQGREAEAVILVLGAPEYWHRRARMWAGGRPNLLNVAASRAKSVLYVIGNRALWRTAGCFRVLDELLP